MKLNKGINDYSDAEVRMATVHAREDISALMVLADYLNVQLRSMRLTLWVIVIILAAILFRVW